MHITACAFGVISALLLLALLPRTLGWWSLLLGPGSQTLWSLGTGVTGSQGHSPSAMARIVRFTGSTTVGRGRWRSQSNRYLHNWRDRVIGPLYYCLDPCGQGHHFDWEAGVICSASLDATRFSGAAGSATTAGVPGSQAPPLLFPWFCLLHVF